MVSGIADHPDATGLRRALTLRERVKLPFTQKLPDQSVGQAALSFQRPLLSRKPGLLES